MDKKIILIIVAILLFVCLLNMPYGYYQFVRFVAMVAFAYLAYIANEQNNKNEAFVYIALVILFQPFMKITLGRTIWNIVDVIAAIGLILSLFQSKNNK